MGAGCPLQLLPLGQSLCGGWGMLCGGGERGHGTGCLQVLHGELARQQHVVELHDAVFDDGQLAHDALDLRLGAALEIREVLSHLSQPRLLHHVPHHATHLCSSLAQVVLRTRQTSSL